MSDVLLVLPLLIPLTTAAVSLLAWRRGWCSAVLAVAGAAGLLGAGAGAARRPSGARRHPRDPGRGLAGARSASPWSPTCSAPIMVVLAGVVGLAVVRVLPGRPWTGRREAFGYYPLVHVLLLGVCGAFLTGDLFNLYVWFEVMLMASFVLLVLGGERAAAARGHQVRHAQPGVVGRVPGRGRHPLRRDRHAEHGRPRPQAGRD